MPAELIAIDVALLIEGDARARLLPFNAELIQDEPGGFAFDHTHLTHLTLLQQASPRDRLDEVHRRIADVAGGLAALPLQVTGGRRHGTTAHAVVAPTTALQALHDQLTGELAPFAADEVTADAFFHGGEAPRERDVAWVQRFRDDAAGDRFDPHITLGVGQPRAELDGFAFTADRLASCRLGRFCTCRVVLAQWRLPSN